MSIISLDIKQALEYLKYLDLIFAIYFQEALKYH